VPKGGFKDNFSNVADSYRRNRPTYPDELFSWLASIAPKNDLAWDCACGNGQAAVGLATHFHRVYATDASSRQIENAERHPKIDYSVIPAERTPFGDDIFDLILVAQAVHWFDFNTFFAEVKRVGRVGGVLALAAYELHRVTPKVDAVTDAFYEPVLGPYWQPERRHIQASYRDIPFPFEEITAPELHLTAEWTAEECLGFLDTWSSMSRYRDETGTDPLEDFAGPLCVAWGTGTRTVRWPLILRVARIK